LAAFSLCDQCVDLLAKASPSADLNAALFFATPPLADPRAAKLLLDHGADYKALDQEGRSILMLLASSATLPSSIVKDLIDRGADVNVKSAKGDTALDLARRHGQTTMVETLVKSGAKEGAPPRELFARPAPAGSIRAAVARSIPLLQRADVSFLQKAGCVSCHNNTLTAMTVATAREHRFQVDNQIAQKQLKNISSYIDDWSERVLLGFGIPGDSDTLSYILLGLAAENHPADASTDALARFLKSKQTADGRWLIFAHRPPLERAGRALLLAVAGFGATTIVFGLSRIFGLSLTVLFLLGALDMISVVIRHTLVQLLTPDDMRGRVSAVNGMFIGISNELGEFESGTVAHVFDRSDDRAFGPTVSAVSGGIGTLFVVAAVALIWPQLRGYGRLDGSRNDESFRSKPD
jgi:hypothetical protein